ncbi:MAG: methyltransferase domain-containing protein [Candidatus Aminicenantes bacterium]
MIWWRRELHKLRFLLKRWSAYKDQEYHNCHFKSAIDHPFRFSYTGYITIRRFADLAFPFLKDCRSVLDIGCGTGEITCELASRLPEIHFFGIDHSLSGIDKARQHADLLSLNNISFEPGKAESFSPAKPVDIVTMFDAFHHLENPKDFIRHMGRLTSEFLLLEPQGDWKGSWKRSLDLDWVLLELDKIQSRLSYMLGEKYPPVKGGTASGKSCGESVEHRYALSDFKQLFKGFGLEIRGTISGLDTYPPGFRESGPFREMMGEWSYELYKKIDDYLHKNNWDLHAKHWLIHARKGASHSISRPSPVPDNEKIRFPSLPAPYQAAYMKHSGPDKKIFPGSRFQVEVTLRNTGFLSWSSSDPVRPVFISYHWQQRSGKPFIHDGERTAIGQPVAPGEQAVINLKVQAPESPGRYVLAVDLVCEGVTWFSQAGSTPLFLPVWIQKP